MSDNNVRLNPEIIQKRFPILDLNLCEKIADVGSWTEIPKGQMLIQEDKYIKKFPLVLDGVLRIYRSDSDGRESLLYYLTRGEVCLMALTCCMEHFKSNVNIVAEEDTDVISVPVRYLDEWLVEYESWKVFVLRSYKSHFDGLLETIDSLAFKKMDERLLSFFVEYQKSTGKKYFQGTHGEIASSLTTSREVISRLLKALEKEGKVNLSRNRVDFLF
ncbi:Crp/Fnr family transcriptional regulator [Halosquirtibacter xylanolyticus]|uniref:Crp/Fnr family transcriptional regulator n=1 Tax=Halosquirtibacter xylanolyticus TaxID=3374599 RepID=UPI00374A3E24|nr:Crp/Fnr family transcriptional regulator [Prolixibacteraceae bacterium]